MKADTLICSLCGETIITSPETRKRAREVYKQDFPEDQEDGKAPVCQDCYRLVLKWRAEGEPPSGPTIEAILKRVKT
jgi:hypothetical protein